MKQLGLAGVVVAGGYYLAGLRDRVLASQRDRRLIGQTLNRGAYASRDYQPHANGGHALGAQPRRSG